MARMTYELSDGLASLRKAVTVCAAAGGLSMEPVSTAQLAMTLGVLEARARKLENELSRHRWNELARTEREAS